jgi:DNA polymerase delta subunit 2
VDVDDATGPLPVDLLEATLRWQHVAPSAPDTLACYPHKDRDPFFMERCPHVYFAGMQRKFGSRLVETEAAGGGAGGGGGAAGAVRNKTLVVSVPSFAATGTIVLVTWPRWSATPSPSGTTREAPSN